MSYQRHVNFLYMFNKDIPIHKQQLCLKNIKKINEGRIFFSGKLVRSLNLTLTFQKQPPKVFCKERCSQKFPKIHRKTTVPEPAF